MSEALKIILSIFQTCQAFNINHKPTTSLLETRSFIIGESTWSEVLQQFALALLKNNKSALLLTAVTINVMNCSICFSISFKSEGISAARCGHCFHTDCIEKWLKESQTCPECKEALRITSLIRLYIKFADKRDHQDEMEKFYDEVILKDERICELERDLKSSKEDQAKLLKQIDDLRLDLEAERELRRIKQRKEASNVISRPPARNYIVQNPSEPSNSRATSSRSSTSPWPIVERNYNENNVSEYLRLLAINQHQPLPSIEFPIHRNPFSVPSTPVPRVASIRCSCATGCRQGYCPCNRMGQGCSSSCGCNNCMNPYGRG